MKSTCPNNNEDCYRFAPHGPHKCESSAASGGSSSTLPLADPESVGDGGDESEGDEQEDEDAGDKEEDEDAGDESEGDEQEGDEEEDSEEGDEDAGDEEEGDEQEGDEDAGDEDERDEEEGDEEEDNYEDDCEDDPRWRKHPRKNRRKRHDCDWVAAKARKRCKKKNKTGVRASEACECACA